MRGAVNRTLIQQHKNDPEKYPAPMLPKRCYGRMRERKLVKVPLQKPISSACQGQYDPPVETASFKVLHLTKQIRRLQSLRQRVAKLEMFPDLGYVPMDLQKEWKAIVNTRSSGNFRNWCLQQPEIAWFPLHFPSTEFLDLTIPLLKHHTDALANQQNLLHQKHAKFLQRYDQQKGYLKNTMHRIRGEMHPPLRETKISKTSDATVQTQQHGLVELRLQHPQEFNCYDNLEYDQQQIQPLHFDADVLTGMLLEADVPLAQTAVVTQHQTTQDPTIVARHLQTYWDQYWTRDDPMHMEDPAHWSDYVSILNQMPQYQQLTIEILDVNLWRQALRQTKSGKARGYDGWFVDELKELPDVCLTTLAWIIHNTHAKEAFPKYLMKAITVPLGKHAQADNPAATRPITLLPVVYRLLAKVVCTQLLKQWHAIIPREILGFMPGRHPHHYMLQLQFQLEQRLMQKQQIGAHWQGLTLDLVKCFNLLPRWPCRQAMIHYGIPVAWVDFWYQTLQHTERWWQLGPSIHHGGRSTTGAPEGDSWSVLACIAISTTWTQILATHDTFPSAYADNWAWRSLSTASNLAALRATVHYTNALRLQIDWRKTWMWSTDSRNKDTWKSQMLQECPPDTDILIVSNARDLGFTMSYNKCHSRATQKGRHEAALQYMIRARQDYLSLDTRGRICGYALSKALWGTESYVVGGSWLKELRSTIAKTLILNKGNSNPYFACSLLTPHVCDPTLYLLQNSIRNLRSWLQQATSEVLQNFFQIASMRAISHTAVWGPAGAMAYNLSRIGWSINKQGILQTDADLAFPLLTCSQKELFRQLDYSWMKHVMQTCIQRHEWKQLPIPDRQATMKLLHDCTAGETRVWCEHITGASMTSEQLKHFTETSSCPLCQMPDSIYHRVLECTATASVRAQFSDHIAILEDLNPCHTVFPALYMPELHDFHQWYYQQVTRPTADAQIHQDIVQNAAHGHRPCFFFGWHL